jgi:hypothetical protein
MDGGAPCAIFDLMAAGSSRRDDHCRSLGRANWGEDAQLADFHGEIIAVPGVSKRTGHSAAAGGEDGDAVAGDSSQQRGGCISSPEGLSERE